MFKSQGRCMTSLRQNYGRELAFRVIRRVVDEHFSEMSGSLPSTLGRLITIRRTHQESGSRTRGEPRKATQALRVSLQVVVDIVLDGCQAMKGDSNGSLEDAQRTIRIASEQLKIPTEMFEQYVRMIAPHIAAVVREGNNLGGVQEGVDPKGGLQTRWHESWQVGSLQPLTELLPSKKKQESNRSLDIADLEIDETQGLLRGKVDLHIADREQCPVEELAALWLALSHTGASLSPEAIREFHMRRMGSHVPRDAAVIRKYPMWARKILKKLLGDWGADLVPSATNGRYYVRGDNWSWRWIRPHRDRLSSYLLSPRAGPVDRTTR